MRASNARLAWLLERPLARLVTSPVEQAAATTQTPRLDCGRPPRPRRGLAGRPGTSREARPDFRSLRPRLPAQAYRRRTPSVPAEHVKIGE